MKSKLLLVIRSYKENANQLICLLLLLVINFVFLYKYLFRINENALIFCFVYSVVQILLYGILKRIPAKQIRKIYIYLVFLLTLLFQFYLLSVINVSDLNTDRWSVINSFLNELMSGNFPYLAKSHLNNPPGPFPGYFLFALPFYFIGEIGLFSLLGVLLILVYFKLENYSTKTTFEALVFICSSVTIWYELVTRSTIFVNMAIVIVFFSYLKKINSNSFFQLGVVGLLGGLILSTRGIVFYIYLVYFTYMFVKNKEWYRLSIYSIFMFIGFILTLLPFALWDWNTFLIYNPITLQANFVPFYFLILFIFIGFLIGYYTKVNQNILGNIGIFLFFVISIPFSLNVIRTDLFNVIVQNKFDISYFIFAIPFMIIGLYEKNQGMSKLTITD